MEQKNNTVILVLVTLATGLFIGWLLWGSKGFSYPRNGSHMMPDGMMMSNSNMMGSMSMNQMMNAMSDGLKGKTGDDFDAAFLEEMIPHHQGAVEMARLVLATSKRPELIKMANDIITAQQKEIDMMRAWQRSWFGVQAQ